MGAMEITRKLHVADGVDLPLDAALARFVVLGKSGAGKSNANVVMAEELIRSGIPTWMLDPLGNLWGLRSSLDGERGGLPVVIFGGQHADAPAIPPARSVASSPARKSRRYSISPSSISRTSVSSPKSFAPSC